MRSPDQDFIELDELRHRIVRGLPLTLALSVVGLAVGVGAALFLRARHAPVSSICVSLPGLKPEAGGQYPDNSPFLAGDLLAPDLIQEALKKTGRSDPGDTASRLRISAVIPTSVAKERERQRAAGENVPFVATEYRLTLIPAAGMKPDPTGDQRVLTELTSAYADRYRGICRRLPAALGHVFDDLRFVDYPSYPPLIREDLQALATQLKARGAGAEGSRFLLRDIERFLAVELEYYADAIEVNGLTKDPLQKQMETKMQLRLLAKREAQLQLESQALTEVLDLYKPQPPATDRPTPAGGKAEHSLATRTVDARLELKRTAVLMARLSGQLDRLQLQPSPSDASQIAGLESGYRALVARVRQCIEKNAALTTATSMQVTQPAGTEPPAPGFLPAGSAGLALGLLAGLGLSLLRSSRLVPAS